MESLVLALGLRVIGSAVADPDTESQEPDGEDGVGIVRVISPRRAVVHEHPDGKAMMAEQAGQGGLNGLVAFIGTGNQSESIAGVVVEDGERMTAFAVGHANVPFEIHLPEVVGVGPLESLPVSRLSRSWSIEAIVATQNGGNRTGRRDERLFGIEEVGAKLPAAPGWMLVAGLENEGFEIVDGSLRAGEGLAGSIRKMLVFVESSQPLVGRFATDLEAVGELRNVGIGQRGQPNEFDTQ
jgi:hypothetical protein